MRPTRPNKFWTVLSFTRTNRSHASSLIREHYCKSLSVLVAVELQALNFTFELVLSIPLVASNSMKLNNL
jgi:hypothetical protein